MSFRKMALAATAGIALASTPVLAQANDASSLSVASAAQTSSDDEGGSSSGFNADWIVPGIIILGVIVVLVLIYTDDEDTVSA